MWMLPLYLHVNQISDYNDDKVEYGNVGCSMRQASLGRCRRQSPRSGLAAAQSDQDIHCSLIESLATAEHNKVLHK